LQDEELFHNGTWHGVEGSVVIPRRRVKPGRGIAFRESKPLEAVFHRFYTRFLPKKTLAPEAYSGTKFGFYPYPL
jgi:hypothetical protein